MNGYDAASKIRNLGGIYKTLPIIALTASAMIEVKNKVNKVGMNDYITKPFSPKELYFKIRKNISANEEIIFEDHTHPEIHKTQKGQIKGINYKKVIDISGGNKAFLRHYNSLAVKMFTEFPAEYEEALEKPDKEKLSKITHGVRATLELLELDDFKKEIQTGKDLIKSKKPDKEKIRETIDAVKNLCREYLDFFKDKY